jgi:acyl-homoserine-lactone acylase
VAWYEAHLCSEEGLNILGGLFPGAPTVLHGCNENLGWAHTVNYHDKMDVFQLEINPANAMQYKMDGQWKTLEMKKIKLNVKGVPFKVGKKIYWSDYGPTLVTKSGTYALRFGGMFDIRAGEQWYKMNKAKDFTSFYDALKMTAITGFNIVYADRYDTIFYISNGKIPLRNKAYNWQGTLPGNTSATLWNGFHPIQDLPQILNPKAGYVFNTNNTPFNATAPSENLKQENFDPTMGIETFELNRSQRFMELMEKYPNQLSYEDFKIIKYDRQLPKKFSYLTDINTFLELKPEQYPDIEILINKFKNWNHRVDLDNTDVTVFLLSYEYLRQKFAKTGENYFRKLREDECVEALRFTKKHLEKHFGSLEVPFGKLQVHQRGQVELPVVGIPDVLAAIDAKFYKDGKLRATNGDSYIELVKFKKNGLPEIETINAYGASNRPESPHYTDQMPLYVRQQTKKMTLDKATVLKEAVRIYHPRE